MIMMCIICTPGGTDSLGPLAFFWVCLSVYLRTQSVGSSQGRSDAVIVRCNGGMCCYPIVRGFPRAGGERERGGGGVVYHAF